MTRVLDDITDIIIHHALTPNGRSISVEEIDDWHRQRGFRRATRYTQLHQPALKHIGYHRVIQVSGVVVHGRSLPEVGAHAVGFNARSIGICLVGTNRFTPAQWDALRSEVLALRAMLGRDLTLAGHRDRGGQGTCPGFDVAAWERSGFTPPKEHVL